MKMQFEEDKEYERGFQEGSISTLKDVLKMIEDGDFEGVDYDRDENPSCFFDKYKLIEEIEKLAKIKEKLK